MSAPDRSYRVERGDPAADRERILQLWERCSFGQGAAASARYDWFYLDNPSGRGRVYLLFHGDELVGSLGAGSRGISCGAGASLLRASILVDFVVDPAHRSMFPALQLQRVAREHELRESQLIYSLPGDKATPVFRRLGFSAQLMSGTHVRVLRSTRFLGRLLPWAPPLALRAACWLVDRARLLLPRAMCRASGVSARWQQCLPDGIEELWDRVAAVPDIATGERHREFLEWRFRASPQREWLVLPVKNRRGNLIAYFVGVRHGDHLRVFDLLLADRDAGVLPLQALVLAARELKFDSVRILFGGCARMHRALKRAGFQLRDERPCFLIQPAGAAQLPREWWLTKADEDV